jgi:transcriptional regulator GlxA family with amidase domain
MNNQATNVAVLALHGVVAFDLTIACDTFARVRLANGRPAYQVRVCGEAPVIKAGLFDLRVPWDLSHIRVADTLIVPGIENPMMPIDDMVLDAVRGAAKRGARIASICSGAFVLAAAGLLDGQRATTHWLAAKELALRYPSIDVDPNVLYVDNGKVLTSAGAAAGIDLCLHMIRRDHGSAIAAEAARRAVVPLERDGGQAQFIEHEPPTSTSSLAPLLQWMTLHLNADLSLERLARRAALSTRTLSRRFREQVGTSPLQWLLMQRVRRAQQLLETSDLSIERIASRVGFASATNLRERFLVVVGTSPTAYRRTFGGEAKGMPARKRVAGAHVQ